MVKKSIKQKHVYAFALISTQQFYMTLMLHPFCLVISESHSCLVCIYPVTEYSVGDTAIPAGDDCNVCTCNDDGTVDCGDNICG